MALSGLDIYKLLPKTNCRQCGFATCLAFAMQLAKKAVPLDKCTFLSEDAKALLEASSQPPIKLVTVGQGEGAFKAGNETVLFRHEEKFHHPCGVGFIIDDSLSEGALKETVNKINALEFERVGQRLAVDVIALRQVQGKEAFLKSLEIVLNATTLGLVLMSDDKDTLRAALQRASSRKPLLFPQNAGCALEIAPLAVEYKCAMVARASDLDGLSSLTKELNKAGVQELMLDTGSKPIAQKLWDLTQVRRLALKKSNRSLGYPMLVCVESSDPYEEVIEAATYISKYAGLLLLRGFQSWQALSLLTLRQNIFTDPQKPLQIEPKIYRVGNAAENSPLLVTTNFSLSYYTVLGEVEASKVPAHIMSVDTEGMSVLTAWAAEKFNAEKVNAALVKFEAASVAKHKKIIIPGYVAVMSGDLQEQSGWEVLVGPKEAAGLPSFLKNL